ncbi:tetrapyrrole methylase family protein/MazG family protein [Sinobaca qinghaiensis]|uniref:Tetrapyrrole methylase family protein/MazG family protein n=1 Tax=Sinobaca qinghaiensis TaxID=342944 RepID=A0A419VU31_9BACL|nr:nucleoside triphosphate pyrophosphohydrolase [Sinobaca qinghaiensis]RKD84152.1 tetrapyrrole methylase family protein/MazG family protein [Sinobaca qinghaiensis]
MKYITIIGLGAGEADQMSFGVYKQLRGAEHIYLRTKEHPAVAMLEEEGIAFQSFDHIYEANNQFGNVYAEIVEKLLEVEEEAFIYAVPGHPLVAEETVQRLIEEEKKGTIQLRIQGGQSFLDPAFSALRVDPNDGFQLLDATALVPEQLMLTQHILISQVYDQMSASNTKLTLMEKYPDDYEVTLVTAAGTSEEKLESFPLFELDRRAGLSNLTALYVPPVKEEALLYREFGKLKEIISILRGPGGCPWDQKQTHASLKRYLIEEAYEVIDAVDEEDDEHLQEELGDVLLQVMLHARIAEEEGFFSIEDIVGTLNEKMIRRHPHVFGDIQAETSEEVNRNWEKIKQAERAGSDRETDNLDVPASFPALMRTAELQKQAAKHGRPLKEEPLLWEMVEAELQEWKEALQGTDKEQQKEAFGSVLFVLVNIANHHKLHPEESLHTANRKFEQRYGTENGK